MLAVVLWQVAGGRWLIGCIHQEITLMAKEVDTMGSWDPYLLHTLSLPSTSPFHRQMGTLNVTVHWSPPFPRTSVIRPPSK